MDSSDGCPVRGCVRRSVCRLLERTDQYLRHGVRHGAVRHRDAGAGGHARRRGSRPARGHVV